MPWNQPDTIVSQYQPGDVETVLCFHRHRVPRVSHTDAYHATYVRRLGSEVRQELTV